MNINPQLFAIQPFAAVERKLAFLAEDLLAACSVSLQLMGFFRWPGFVWFQPAVIMADRA